MKLRPIAAALASLAGAAGATTFDPDLSQVPVEFHGRWDLNARACAGMAGRTRLEISADRLRFAGDGFKVSGVSVLDDRYIGVSSDYVGPGAAWRRTDHFTLSADGATLTAWRAGRTVIRRRCEPSRPGSAKGRNW